MKRLYDWSGRVTCIAVVDGDTIRAAFDQGFGNTFTTKRLRFAGIDAAEKNSKDLVERALAKAAAARVLELLPPGAVFSARTDPDPEKFGGYLAWITLADDTDLNALLVREGLARPYTGGKR